jgi:hypothetical protein
VLNFTVGNDVLNVRTRWDDNTGLPRPYFTLEGGALVLHREHLRRSPLGRVAQWISDYSELYDLVRPLLPERRTLVGPESRALGPKKGLRLTVALISRMQALTAAAGAKFVVVLHPDRATFEQRPSVADGLAQGLASAGVTSVTSLAGRYRGWGYAWDLIAMDDVGHLTRLGHRMAADEIERVIASALASPS